MKKQRLFFSGTSNIVLPVRNKTFFPAAYQDKTRLTYYASLFNSVEVNSSFYKLPLSRTIRKWADEVPDGFRFTFKLFNDVTHATKQAFNLQCLPEFLNRISTTEKKGCLIIQLPPKFGVDLFQLGRLLAELPDAWPLAVEFRNPTWYTDEVFRLLNDHQATMVIHDMQRSRAPLEMTSDKMVYLRFHGPEGSYRGSYSDDFLAEYAGYINEWLNGGRTVYTYFNNTMGNAVQNLITLNRFVNNS
ncbi:MAG TPA: DUF72 domain-containing protein [Puia sp.]|jgi:uncharacterized protein YecE (DUF72 family)|nr:DUF72 domain-containing protein [Puia sp.]